MKEEDLPKIEKGEPEYGFSLIVNIRGAHHIMLFLHGVWNFFETKGLENRDTVINALNITPTILPSNGLDKELLKNYQNNVLDNLINPVNYKTELNLVICYWFTQDCADFKKGDLIEFSVTAGQKPNSYWKHTHRENSKLEGILREYGYELDETSEISLKYQKRGYTTYLKEDGYDENISNFYITFKLNEDTIYVTKEIYYKGELTENIMSFQPNSNDNLKAILQSLN